LHRNDLFGFRVTDAGRIFDQSSGYNIQINVWMLITVIILVNMKKLNLKTIEVHHFSGYMISLRILFNLIKYYRQTILATE